MRGKKGKGRRESRAVLFAEAKKRIKHISPMAAEAIKRSEREKLIHELRVHQIELEMQNEALSSSVQETKESKEKYERLFRFVPIGVLEINKDGRIVEINRAAEEMLGLARGKGTGVHLQSVLKESSLPVFYKFLAGMAVGSKQENMEADLSLPGERKIISLTGACGAGEPGKAYYYVAAQDITKLRQADEVLKRDNKKLEELVEARVDELSRTKDRLDKVELSNSELESFASAAAHDLLSPLRIITSYVELLKVRYGADEESREYIRYITKGAFSMQKLVQGLLEYGRAANRKETPERVDTNAVVDEIVANCKLDPQCGMAGLDITRTDLPAMNIARVHVTQLFQNLILNAIKFRAKDRPPVIRISCRQKTNGDLEFGVQDNGIGIEKQFFKKIFNAFVRLNTADEYPGSGIGLATCKKIIERYGGRMHIFSRFGEGTTFYFILPGNLKADPAWKNA